MSSAINVECQDLDHYSKDGEKVIKLSFWNLYGTMRVSDSRFKELMDRYGYVLCEGWYKATSSVESPLYYVRREPNKVVMQWMGDDTFCRGFRDEASKFFVGSEEVFDVYAITKEAEPGIMYLIYLQNEGELRSVLMRRLEVKLMSQLFVEIKRQEDGETGEG